MAKTGPWNTNKVCCGTCVHSEETETDGRLDCNLQSGLCPRVVMDFDDCAEWEPGDGNWTEYL